MRISEEIDALEVMGIPSLPFLVTTRMIAAFIAVIPLYVVALCASYLSPRLIVTLIYGQSPGTYDHYFLQFLPPIDMLWSFGKLLFLAAAVILIHCYYGYTASGGPAGVGHGRGPRDPHQHRDDRRRRLLPQLRHLGLHHHRADHGVGAAWAMLVNIHHDSKREHNRLLVAGVVFLTVIALLIALLDRDLPEDLRARHDGHDQGRPGRPPARQVRRRPAQRRAGRPGPRRSSQDGEEAVDHGRARARRRPRRSRATSTVEILPTTLFGQKFISFVMPDDPSEESLEDGDVIPSDRVDTNVELSQILADLFPLLRAVRPADLNATLNALATALEGRGEQLGETLDELESTSARSSAHLPTLREDLIKLADVADTYDLAAPDLLAVLRNLTVTAPHGRRAARRPRRVLLRPRRPGRHLDPDPAPTTSRT